MRETPRAALAIVASDSMNKGQPMEDGSMLQSFVFGFLGAAALLAIFFVLMLQTARKQNSTSSAAAAPVRPARRTAPPLPFDLPFKDNDAFFEYQCKFGVHNIKKGQGIVGQVAFDITDVTPPLDPLSGDRYFAVGLISPDGSIDAVGVSQHPLMTITSRDLIMFVPLDRNPNAPHLWFGRIVATLEPILSKESGFVFRERVGGH